MQLWTIQAFLEAKTWFIHTQFSSSDGLIVPDLDIYPSLRARRLLRVKISLKMSFLCSRMKALAQLILKVILGSQIGALCPVILRLENSKQDSVMYSI